MKRDPIESYRAPFSLEEVESELKFALWCSASQIALSGLPDIASQYLGFEPEYGPNDDGAKYIDRIDLARFEIARTVSRAYEFAFQMGNSKAFGEDDWMDLSAFRAGAAGNEWSGTISPLKMPESRLSHVADMALARMSLKHGHALTIRQLGLLANMTEAAVRSALSLEGIKTEGRPASLSAEVAEPWLLGRRGFTPTQTEIAPNTAGTGELQFSDLAFPEGFAMVLDRQNIALPDLATQTDVNEAGVRALKDGCADSLSVPELIRISNSLAIDPQLFLQKITEHVMASSGSDHDLIKSDRLA